MPRKMNKNKRSPKSDDGSSSESDEETMMSSREYKQFLNSIFPSSHLQKQLKDENNEKKVSNKKTKKNSKVTKKSNKKAAESPKSSNKNEKPKKKEKLDIIFTILPQKKKNGDDDIDEDDDEEFEDDDDSEYTTESSEEESEEEDDEDDSDYEEESEEEEETEEDEESEEESVEESDESEEEPNVLSKKEQKNKKEQKESDEEAFYNDFKTLVNKAKKTNMITKEMKKEFVQFEKSIKKKKEKMDKKEKLKNLQSYIDLVSNKTLINDVKFFRHNLSCNEQKKLLTELEKVKHLTKLDKPYRIQLLENKEIPDKFKAVALKKINSMKVIAEGGGEYNKLKNWIDTFMRIPFNKVNTLPISRDDDIEDIHNFMENSQTILDEAVYGMVDAKSQFMQMLAQWVANPMSIGNSIAIKGPMGTGKTTLIKNGVSKLLNREFAFIALGGATDSSFLEGHSYTYEGSTYGKIIDILIQCKSSNPVIYFDELDKVSDTPKGEEIIGILTHLTDTTQNDKFHDKYFSEIDFDLSKCLFIFSYNDESKINPILKDRMYNIETSGYNVDEKVIICNNYLIPSLEKELNMEKSSIVLSDEIIRHIVEKYTNGEKGVRNLKRCLEIVFSKINLYKFMKPGTTLFGESIIENIEYPFNITTEIADKIIKLNNQKNTSYLNMYL